MIFVETALAGAFVVEPDIFTDHRGFLARTFCAKEFAAQGLESGFVQSSLSFNRQKGTLRGMHFQKEPHAEDKLVRCEMGAIFDVIIDLRRQSPTFCRWFGIELNDSSRKALYIPKGFAHGFITLTDNALVSYQMTQFYAPRSAAGVRYNDPAFGIEWPLAPSTIVERDANYEDFIL
jgi:dTDP-4-dehydrorhamnose 3,5-epimerase